MLTAWVNRYTAKIHENRLNPPSSATMVGIAVATMVLSTAAMNVAIRQAASTRPRRTGLPVGPVTRTARSEHMGGCCQRASGATTAVDATQVCDEGSSAGEVEASSEPGGHTRVEASSLPLSAMINVHARTTRTQPGDDAQVVGMPWGHGGQPGKRR